MEPATSAKFKINFILITLRGNPPVSRATYLLLGFLWAKTQSHSSSRLNPVNSSSLSHGNVLLIAAYAHADKGIFLFPNNP